MDETQTTDSPESMDADLRSNAESENKQPLGGFDVNLGDFSRTQCLLKSLRLMLNNQIVVQVEEIASGVNEAGRKFKVGELEQANHDIGRLYSNFRQKTNQWESQARNLEQQLRMKAAKNPKSVSIDTMNRMKSEQTAVRTRIRTAEVQFRRLHQGLEQAYTNLMKEPIANSESPANLQAGFEARFKVAAVADRPKIINEWFEIDAVLKVQVSRDAESGYKIKFDLKPPLDRLYFLTMTAQLIRLQQLNQVVRFEDLETGQVGEMKLKEFVKHMQNGVWLLKPRS